MNKHQLCYYLIVLSLILNLAAWCCAFFLKGSIIIYALCIISVLFLLAAILTARRATKGR
jgi:hypothetical protein